MEFSFYVQNVYLETSLAFPLQGKFIFESVLTLDFLQENGAVKKLRFEISCT